MLVKTFTRAGINKEGEKMKQTLIYGSLAVITVGAIALFYNSMGSQNKSCFAAAIAKKTDSSQEVQKVKWPAKYKQLAQNSEVNKTKTDVNKTVAKNSVDTTLPPEIQEVEKEANSLLDDARKLSLEGDKLFAQADADAAPIDDQIEKADAKAEELASRGLIDLDKIKEDTASMTDPASDEEIPSEVAPIYQEAKKTQKEIEKNLEALKILNQGE